MDPMRSAEIIKALGQGGLSQGELAARAGVARETLSRWATGAQTPSMEALERVVAAAGSRLDVRLLPPESKLIELVHDQLDVAPTDRLKALLNDDWSSCRDALRAAAAVADLAVMVGPVGAALSGAPQRPGDGRVDLLVPPEVQEHAADRLLAADAHPDGFEEAPGGVERRERWTAGDGRLTLRWHATGVHDVAALRDRARPVMLNRDGVGLVRIALVEDLANVCAHSPWSEDALYLEGLRAVLASGRYSSRRPRNEVLELA
ncbi:MAG: helix-turn-helix transcriptional regulator [Solirubrobacteraceae bacterium]